jgi:anti-anti-sigma regulatory factor
MSSTTGTELLRSQEAMDIIANEKDPITRALLTNANFWFLKRYFEHGRQPAVDLDYGFVVELLRDVFREHDVLRRMLAGERVGQFFEDEPQDATLQVRLIGSEPLELVLHGRLDVTTAPQLQSWVYDVVSVPHRHIAFDCKHLSVINPWVIAIVWSFAEDVRQAGVRAEVRGLDPSWDSYLEALTETSGRRNTDHDSFMKSLFRTFSELSSHDKRRE